MTENDGCVIKTPFRKPSHIISIVIGTVYAAFFQKLT